jgi:NAD(P)-dependent dehydrogenase (short-subunit alcohol dehydrogenase family)
MNTCTRPHVLVTGASTGIGRATALDLAARGQHVYAGVRRPTDGAALEKAAAEAASPGELTPLLLDVTDPAQIAAAVDTVTGHVGPAGLTGLVNNAGIGVFAPLELTGVETFRRILEINVTGQLALTQAFLPLLRRDQGRIVMIGSIGARFTPPFVGSLAATKSALAAMTEALRQELAPWNIRVVLVEPASIHSEAVGKLDHDTRQLMDQASPEGRALYEDAFGRLVAGFSALHEKGSPPSVVARTVAHALTASRPRARYLTGKNGYRMAFMAAVLPTRAQDALRRKLAHQPVPGSRVGVPPAVTATADRVSPVGR